METCARGRGAARGRHRAAAAGGKRGLALINGTQTSTALRAARALRVRAGARIGARDRRAHGRCGARQRRPVRRRASMPCAASRDRSTSRATTASCLPAARSAAAISKATTGPGSVLLRCQPQVGGACLDQLRHAALVLLREANAVTDNPLVFAEDHALISGGNFHAEPVALACDAMRPRSPRSRDRRAPDRDC